IYPHIRSFISPNQHGFMDKHSTITNLATFTQFVCEAIDAGSQVDAVYTDFAKAFDRIDHSLVMRKLEVFGFSNKLLCLFKSFLTARNLYDHYSAFSSFCYDV